jgi:hypothetical protein
MPTKKRKARRPNVPLYTGPVAIEPRPEPAAAPQTMAAAGTPAARPSAASGAIRADYTYVINDLKRIALVAGSLIAALVVLSFFIR